MATQYVRNRDNGIRDKGIATQFGFHHRKEAEIEQLLLPAQDDIDAELDIDIDDSYELPASPSESGDWPKELDEVDREHAKQSIAMRRAERRETLQREAERVYAMIDADQARYTGRDSVLFNPRRFGSAVHDTLLPTRQLWADDIKDIAPNVDPASELVQGMLASGDEEGLWLEVSAGETSDEDDIAIIIQGSSALKQHLLETNSVSPYASMLALCDSDPAVRNAALTSPFTADWVLGRMQAVKSYDVHQALASNASYPYLREVVQDSMQDAQTRRTAYETLQRREITPPDEWPMPVRKVSADEHWNQEVRDQYRRSIAAWREAGSRGDAPRPPRRSDNPYISSRYDEVPRYGEVASPDSPQGAGMRMLDSPATRRQADQYHPQPYAAL